MMHSVRYKQQKIPLTGVTQPLAWAGKQMVRNIASTHVYEHVKWMCVLPVKSRISYKEMDFTALIVKLTLIYMSTHKITLFE